MSTRFRYRKLQYYGDIPIRLANSSIHATGIYWWIWGREQKRSLGKFDLILLQPQPCRGPRFIISSRSVRVVTTGWCGLDTHKICLLHQKSPYQISLRLSKFRLRQIRILRPFTRCIWLVCSVDDVISSGSDISVSISISWPSRIRFCFWEDLLEYGSEQHSTSDDNWQSWFDLRPEDQGRKIFCIKSCGVCQRCHHTYAWPTGGAD